MFGWIRGVTLALLLILFFADSWLGKRAFSSTMDTSLTAAKRASSLDESGRVDVVIAPKYANEAPVAFPPPVDVASPSVIFPNVIVERAPTPALSQTLNVLLVGVDQRPDQKYGGRPDTILVAALSERDGHLGLISVPRDLYVEIPEHGWDRINATFSVAQSRKEDPLELLSRVVSDTLKLPINHTMSLNLSGFERVIDALGGVDVDVPCPIMDNFLDSRTQSGRRILSVPAGRQHLDGVTAALYVRSRHGRSDFSRARRQQAVLLGLKRKFSSLEGLTRIPEFLEQLTPLITSNMTRRDLLHLMRAASNIEPERLHGLVLGSLVAEPHYTEDGKAVLRPNYAAIDRSLSQLFSSELPGTEPAHVSCPKADVALTSRRPKKPSATPDKQEQEAAPFEHSTDAQ